ncbi:MAG: hypothetical protein M1827_000192 [Pycnora praestabilis]|nr:MAG: hypothetical protein M1827_000192 [Pycnora praestabilis]
MRSFVSPIAACLAVIACTSAQNNSALPIVDLGYELHQASALNTSGQYYNFSNIRYAAPPLGNLRFAAPVPPSTNRSVVNTGTAGVVCPQANPSWELIAAQIIPGLAAGNGYNLSSIIQPSNSTTQVPLQDLPVDPRTTEDCLFLDVIVPQQIFAKAGNNTNGTGAAVLVWIYGGGYTAGDKSGSGNPAGLIQRSENATLPGVIYVAMNYRLGAFGWLSGPDLQANGTANAGLYDQRLALEWVQANIHLFGGDPNRVTVIGESAGGGSIMHQITAFGGVKAPFQQAILQSPGFVPFPSNNAQEDIYLQYLALLNVTTVQQARQLPSSALQFANIIQVAQSTYGSFTYGPVVDGSFSPAPPGKLLLQGAYDTTLNVMVGHNEDEGLLFTSPYVTTDSDYAAALQTNFPDISPSVLNYITQVLYPPIFDGSYGYKIDFERDVLTTSESIFTCNTYYLDRAYGNQTYAYFFSVPPALHGFDVPYTYFNGPNPSVISDPVALALQEYITSFAETGNPNRAGVPYFPMYSNQSVVENLNVTGITQIRDPTANARCLWWQKALYY